MTNAVQPAAPPNIWDALENWAPSLKGWQRLTLALAVKHGRLGEEQIEQVHDAFLDECDLARSESSISAPVTIAAPVVKVTGRDIQLFRLDGLTGINALPKEAALKFGPNLTVIYGRNGAGKSGFARLFANACFCRNTPEILHNIYDDRARLNARARFHLRIDGDDIPAIEYPDGEGIEILKSFSVFDRIVADRHISTNISFEFKPSGFDVFPEMVRVYGQIADRIQASIQQRTEENTLAASFLGGTTVVSGLVATLGADTDRLALRNLAAYGAAESARFQLVESQLLSLRNASSKEAIADLDAARLLVTELLQKLGMAEIAFSTEMRAARERLVQSAISASTVLEAASIEHFRRAFFKAVGSPEWEHFIRAAYDLGKKEHEHYPEDGALCLLCERPLDASSREHVKALFRFVVSEAQQSAEMTSDALEGEIVSLQAIDLGFFAVGSLVRSTVRKLKPELEAAIVARLTLLDALRVETIGSIRRRSSVKNAEETQDIYGAITSLLAEIVSDIENLNKEDKEDAIAELEKERLLLRHREVLSSILPSVERFIENAEWCARASRTRPQFNTKRVTEKEKELFAAVLGESYRTRLAEECAALDCDIPVEMQTQGKAGETVRALLLRGGHKPDRILSEGEQKALALADFLTEINLNEKGRGVVFDDPVSSQDHQRKERVATRLVREASVRQVIVFIHDLVFLNQLVSEAERNGLHVQKNRIDRHLDGAPGRVTLDDAPATSKEYDTANRARWHLANAKSESGTVRDVSVRLGMGALRTTVEQLVPKWLFKGVVPQWSDRVIVSGLRRIEWDNSLADDVVDLFEDLSKYLEGHTHSDEASGAPPEPKDLEGMIGRAEGLIKRARKAERSKPSPVRL